MKPLTTEEVIRRAARVREFVDDEAVQAALGGMKLQIDDDLLTASSMEDLRNVQARARNWKAFTDQLQVARDAGERAMYDIARAAKREAEI